MSKGAVTMDEAAKALGVHWRTIRGWMLIAGWTVDVGGGIHLTSHGARAAGYLRSLTVARDTGARPPIVAEVGFRILPAGLSVLRRELRQ